MPNLARSLIVEKRPPDGMVKPPAIEKPWGSARTDRASAASPVGTVELEDVMPRGSKMES